MGIQEGITDAAKLLVPPRERDGPRFRRWQWAVAAGVFLLAVTVAAHIALACGLIPTLYPGFANAGEVSQTRVELQNQVKAVQADAVAIRLAIWDQQLFNLRLQQCNEPNRNLRAALLEKIAEIQGRYRTLTGREPALINCGDL